MAQNRPRKGSVMQAINDIETDPQHHLTGPFVHNVNSSTEPRPQRQSKRRKSRAVRVPPAPNYSRGLWGDLTSLNWAKVPSSALVLVLIPPLCYLLWERLNIGGNNPFKYLLFIQYELPPDASGQKWYRKGYGDLAFLCYYIVVFSFLRQLLTLHVYRPWAYKLGIPAKVDRFVEQAYAITYFSITGTFGLMTMKGMPTWYFEGEHFFREYPYWRISANMKWYYLLQFAYWLHQFLVLVLGLEKPRKDFKELVAHHVVTLWLIGWSYLVNLTPIGNAVFITMDISDIFLSLSIIASYIKIDPLTIAVFVPFVFMWGYLRHYLNLYILWTVINYFDLIPAQAQVWAPETGAWLVPWMKWQIFVPLAIIQGLNMFWYFLILRILYRALFQAKLVDDRSDDEDEGEPDEAEHDKDD